MKKIVAILTAVLLLLQCAPVAALATDDATEKVSVMEFCELYTKRIMEFNEDYGASLGELDDSIYSSFLVFDHDDTYSANCSGGLLTLNKEDLTIESMTTTIMDLSKDPDDEEGYNVMIKAMYALSALELSDLGAEGLGLLHNTDPSRPEDLFMALLTLFNDTINTKITSNMDNLTDTGGVLVYQGNYDYYAEYRKYTDRALIYLTAEARE